MGNEVKIPVKWSDVYKQCKDFIENPGEPSTAPVNWCVSVIEDLATAEAKIAELEWWMELCPDVYSLSNSEIRATGLLGQGAVLSIARELIVRRHENASLQQQLQRATAKVSDEELTPYALLIENENGQKGWFLDAHEASQTFATIIAARTEQQPNPLDELAAAEVADGLYTRGTHEACGNDCDHPDHKEQP